MITSRHRRFSFLAVASLLLLASLLLVNCSGSSGGGGTNPTYTVTYDKNGSDSGTAPTDSTKYEAGQIVTVPGNTGALVKAGYSFVGWNTLSNGTGTTYTQSQTFVMGSANVKLYANWTANPTFTVTYNGNGNTTGSVPTDSTTYEEGQTVTVLGNTGSLVKTGYSFIGWNTAANGSGTTYTQTQTFTMGSANVILYAQWTTNPTYTVTYNGNGNTLGSVPVDSTTYEQGQTVTVLQNTGNLAKSNSTFGGWNTLADGTGTTYGSTFVMGTVNLTLYAKWDAAVPGAGMFDSPANPIIVTAATDTTYSVTALIPVTGGTISAIGEDGSVFTLTVPSDALQFPTEITMTPVTDIPDLPFAAGLGAAVKLEPEGLRFYNFVTLTIEPAVSIPLANQTFFGFQSTGGDFQLAPPVLDSTAIQMKLLHFSGVGVSDAPDAERAAVLLTNASDAENRLQQSMAEVIRQIREDGATLDPTAFNAILQEYMDQVVTPRVDAALTSCTNGKLAMETVIGLMRQKELLGLATDDLQSTVDSLILWVAGECLDEAYNACVNDHNLLEVTRLVLGYERQRQLLNYTGNDNPWDAYGQRLIKQCLTFELAFSSTEQSSTTSAVTGTIPLVADLSAFPAAITIKSISPSPLDLTSVASVGACNQLGVDNSNNMEFVVSNLNFVFGGTDAQTITSMEMEYLPLSPTAGIAETSCSGTPVPLSTVTAWNDNYLYTHQLEDNGTGTLVSQHWSILGGDPYAQRLYIFTTPGYGQTTMTLRHTPGAIDTTDVTAPSVPAGLTATANSSSQINLAWSAATDEVGVKGYKVYRDGTYIKATTATSMLNTGLTASTQYCYQISAYDAAGNESTKSTEQCATTPAVRFTDNGDGTMTDNTTGLIWLKSPDYAPRSWQAAMDYYSTFNFAGYTDWRETSDTEFSGLIQGWTGATPNDWLISQGFSLLNATAFWSSVTYAGDTSQAWTVNTYDGVWVSAPKAGTLCTWPVRSRFVDNLDGTMTDTKTGLMWIQSPDSTMRDWQTSMDYSDALDFAGYTDWRVPTSDELQGVIQGWTGATPAAWLTLQGFSNVLAGVYWSSTTDAGDTTIALWVYMGVGNMVPLTKNDLTYVWSVRTGP